MGFGLLENINSFLSTRGISMTKDFEGYEPLPYYDNRNNLTVGYGFNLSRPEVQSLMPQGYMDSVTWSEEKGGVPLRSPELTKDESDSIFGILYNRAQDDAVKYLGSQKSFDALDEDMKDNLVDMSYNLGLPKLQGFKEMRKGFLSKDKKKIADEMKDSDWYWQTGRRSKHHVESMKGQRDFLDLSMLNPFAVKEASASEIGKGSFGLVDNLEEKGIGLGLEDDLEPLDPRDALTLGQKILVDEKKTDIVERIGKGFGTGVASMVEGMGGVAKWFGVDKIGDSINAYADKMKTFYEVPDPNFITQVAAGVGSMTTFLVPGLGISKGVQAVSFMPRLAVWLGVSASSIMEASVEAGGAYNKMRSKGEDHKEASASATKNFWLNLPVLVFTNKFGIFGENGNAILKGLKSAGGESVQEFTQQLIGNFSTKDPLMEGALESAAVGAIVGGGTGVIVGAAEDIDLKRAKGKEIGVIREEIQTTKEGLEKAGIKKEVPSAEEITPEVAENSPEEGIEREKEEGVRIRDIKEVGKEEKIEFKIPEMKETEDAIALGESIRGDEAAIDKLKQAKIEQDKITDELQDAGDPATAEVNKSQLLREAIETAEKKPTLKEEPVVKAEPETALIEEAKKFKTAEEFVEELQSRDFIEEDDRGFSATTTFSDKASGALKEAEFWHGTNVKKFDKFQKGQPVFLTKSSGFANEYGKTKAHESGKGDGKIFKVSVDKKIKFLDDIDDISEKLPENIIQINRFGQKAEMSKEDFIDEFKSSRNWELVETTTDTEGKRILDIIKDAGFGGVKMNELEDETFVIFDSEDVTISSSKQQLTEIYNKAQQPPVSAEAKPDVREEEVPQKKLRNILKEEKGSIKIPFEWEAEIPTKETMGDAFKEHVSYYEDMQLPEDSEIRIIKKQIQTVNGKRLSGKITPTQANIQISKLRGNLIKTAIKEGVSIVRTEKGKYKLGMRERSGVFVPDDFSKYTKYKDFKSIAGGIVDTTRMLQEIDGALSIKNKVSEPGQAGPAERYIGWRTRDILIQKMDFAEQKGQELSKIFKGIRPNSKEDLLLTTALERGDNVGLSSELSRKADNLRNHYNSLLDHQNELREMRGQEPIPFRRNYSPQMLAKAVVWGEFFNKKKDASSFQKEAFMPDYIMPNKTFNPHEMAREGGLDYSMLLKSSYELARRYLGTASKDIFNTSIIQNNKAFISQLEALGHKNASDALAKWNAEAFAGVKAGLDKWANLPKGITNAMKKVNSIRNLAVFPFRVAWTTGTQLKSLSFTVGRYGYLNTFNGVLQYLNPRNRQQLRNIYSFRVKTAKSGKVSAQDNNNFIDGIIDDKRSVVDKWNDAGRFILEEMEKILTGASVFAGYNEGKERGLKGRALNQFASDAGGKTQSMYNDEDKPGILRNVITKSIAPYQTFKFEMLNSIRELAGKTGTPPDNKREAVAMFLRFVSAAILMRLLADHASKKDAREITNPVPFSQWTVDPVIDKAIGRQGYPASTLPSMTGMATEITDGIVRSAQTKKFDRKLRNSLIKYTPGLFGVGGGMQAANLTDSLISYSQGGIYDKSGRLMFRVEKEDVARGIYSGVWTTRGGEEYKEKKFIRPKILQKEWAKGIFGKKKVYPTTKKEYEKIPESMKVGKNKILLKTEKKPRKVIFTDTRRGAKKISRIKEKEERKINKSLISDLEERLSKYKNQKKSASTIKRLQDRIFRLKSKK